MKKIMLVIMAMALQHVACGQTSIAGDWQGTLTGTGLRLVFHIAEKDGVLVTRMDSPDQGANGIPCDKTSFTNGRLVITLAVASASYEGVFNSDSSIAGKWTQRGASIQLDLVRKKGNEKPEVKPQTPVPPFSYNSEDVEYDNESKSIHYGATLTTPKVAGQFPAAVLITGSGLQDRDETIGAHKSFAVIADYLTKKGIAVLRVDDRGRGKSTGDTKNATSADFAMDVETSLAFLKTRKEINIEKIGLIGHSEGGLIGPMVAARHKDIAFVIMLAGPGIPIPQLMAEQSEAVLRSSGLTDDAIRSYTSFYRKLISIIPGAVSEEAAKSSAMDVFRKWQTINSSEIVTATTGVHDSTSAKAFIGRFVGQVYSPWFRYFLSYDPQPALAKLTCPVLALNGEKDIQVLAKTNLPGIRASLRKNKKNKIMELPGLNHLFQTCKTCTTAEYFTLQETFSPQVLGIMSDWLTTITNNKQ